MLKKITELGSLQANATEQVSRQVDAFLQYAATYPVTKITYHASDIMTLHNPSDASYLGETRGRSRIAGFHFLGQQHRSGTIPIAPINGGLLIRSSILDVVVSSAKEAELGGLFENMRDATSLRNILADMGYPQPASPMQTDTNWRKESHKIQLSLNAQKHLICVTTGCAIESSKANLLFTGAKAGTISPTISQKITLRLIIRLCDPISSPPKHSPY
jgi:hypothetical protein